MKRFTTQDITIYKKGYLNEFILYEMILDIKNYKYNLHNTRDFYL